MKKMLFAMMALVAATSMFMSCSDDDDNDIPFEDPTQPRLTGFVVSAKGRDLEGTAALNAEVITPTVMYDSCSVKFFHRYMEYHFSNDSTSIEAQSYVFKFHQKDLGWVIADSIVYAPDSLSFAGDAIFSREGVEEEIPARVESDSVVEGYPVRATMSFVHPKLGKTVITFYKNQKEEQPLEEDY